MLEGETKKKGGHLKRWWEHEQHRVKKSRQRVRIIERGVAIQPF